MSRSEPATLPQTGGLDEDVVQMLVDTIGWPMTARLMGDAIESINAHLTILSASDLPLSSVHHEAHKLVSVAGNLGFTTLSQTARQLMLAARDGDELGTRALQVLLPELGTQSRQAAVAWLELADPGGVPDGTTVPE
jgi:HPt (histidine-containing phosphotransfer) domain-containing protein